VGSGFLSSFSIGGKINSSKFMNCVGLFSLVPTELFLLQGRLRFWVSRGTGLQISLISLSATFLLNSQLFVALKYRYGSVSVQAAYFLITLAACSGSQRNHSLWLFPHPWQQLSSGVLNKHSFAR
jgi:hypothetical protein